MQISEHHVRECAYFIWENEGRLHGQAATHWLRAETELRANAMLAAPTVTEAVAAPQAAASAPAKAASKAASKAAKAAKVDASKAAAPKAAAPKTAAPKTAAPKTAVAKPAAPKPVRASKAAVTAGLAAKAKPARTPAAMH